MNFEIKMEDNFSDVNKFVQVERHIYKCHKKELDNYMAEMNKNFIKLDAKLNEARREDNQKMLDIHDENHSLKQMVIEAQKQLDEHSSKIQKQNMD